MIDLSDTPNLQSLSNVQISKIEDFINNRIDEWIKTNPNTEFSVKSLFGNDNWNWNGTDIQQLHDINSNKGYDEAFVEAGKYAGILLNKIVKSRSDVKQISTPHGVPYKYIKK